MALAGIKLSAQARANLLALQQTSSLLAGTENSLATGKKINSSLDDAAAYFAQKSFLNSSGKLNVVDNCIIPELLRDEFWEQADLNVTSPRDLLNLIRPRQDIKKVALMSISANYTSKRYVRCGLIAAVCAILMALFLGDLYNIFSAIVGVMALLYLIDGALVMLRLRGGTYGTNAIEAKELMACLKKYSDVTNTPGGAIKIDALYESEVKDMIQPYSEKLPEGAVA